MDSLQYDGHCRDRRFFTPIFLLYYFFTHSLYLLTRDEDVLILLHRTQDMPQVTLASSRHGSWEDSTDGESFLVSILLHTVFSRVLSGPKVTSEWVAPIFRFRVKNISSS